MEPNTAVAARSLDPGVTEEPSRRVTFVTDIVTPYMVTQFEALARLTKLHVVFCSESGSRAMPWQLGARLSFSHEVVGGLSLPGLHSGADLHLSPRILGAIARSRPDVVVASGYSMPTAYTGLWCAASRRPLVIYSAGTSRSERSLGRVQALARRILLARTSSCAAASFPAAERFRELGVPAERIFMTSHTSDLAPLWPVGRDRTYAATDTLRIVSVGRLIVLKGNDRLIRAAATAIEAGVPVEVRFVGSGPEEERLRRLASELGISHAVRFDGFLDHADLPAVYAEADVFAFPTLRDVFGHVLVEAAATGLPPIASTQAGATHDMIEHERNGLVVDPDDLAGMTDAILRLARDPALRERLGRAAHQSTLQRTPDRSAQGFVEAVEAALA
ncbi:MAG: glycosyltransferase family 4 protein [Gaiellaceae bacterium]